LVYFCDGAVYENFLPKAFKRLAQSGVEWNTNCVWGGCGVNNFNPICLVLVIVSGDQGSVSSIVLKQKIKKDNKLEKVVQLSVECLDQEGGRQVG
jgi:hypothetical protein